MKEFNGQKVLVSGATRGIGKAISRRFLEEGALVIGVYAGNNEAAELFADENKQFSGSFELLQCCGHSPAVITPDPSLPAE